jgi:hypothetical protein
MKSGDVRFWHSADVLIVLTDVCCRGVTRTLHFQRVMSYGTATPGELLLIGSVIRKCAP